VAVDYHRWFLIYNNLAGKPTISILLSVSAYMVCFDQGFPALKNKKGSLISEPFLNKEALSINVLS